LHTKKITMTKLQGKIKQVFQTETYNNFDKRIFWIQELAEKFANTFQLELWKDDCKMIDNYKVGDYVTIYIDIKGKSFNRKDGTEGVINTLKCWNIEKDGKPFKEIVKP